MATQTQRRLDCSACGSAQSMAPTQVSKMSGVVQLIGWLIVVPSLLGVLFAALMFVAGLFATGEVSSTNMSDAEAAGAGLGLMMTSGTSLCLGASSLVSGLIGYLLIMKKKVWKCTQCGYHIDRD